VEVLRSRNRRDGWRGRVVVSAGEHRGLRKSGDDEVRSLRRRAGQVSMEVDALAWSLLAGSRTQAFHRLRRNRLYTLDCPFVVGLAARTAYRRVQCLSVVAA